MFRPVEVKALPGYELWLRYEDGTQGKVDLSRLVGHGVFTAIKDPVEFAKVRIHKSGAIAWAEDIDLCPDALYLEITGQRAEDVFPSLRRASSDA